MRHLLFSDKKVLRSHINLPNISQKLSGNVGNEVVLITGATGFIGGFLLKELLLKGFFKSYICLVRSDSKEAGLKRLTDNLLDKGCPQSLIDKSAIKVVIGDVLAPSFGLDIEEESNLIASVDHVFHFAATMNWITPFNQDTISNIEALKRVITLCSKGKLKKLHYASSMGIWTLKNHGPGPILETELHDQGEDLPGGYFQSKWVNERILQMASNRGLPVNIYRIGDVKGDSENGLGDPQNFGNLVMRYFVEKRIVIDSDIPEFNFLPVDYITKAIAHIATKQESNTYQFSNPELVSFKDIYNVSVGVGYKCSLVSKEEWREELKNDKSLFGKTLKPIFREFTPETSAPSTSFYDIGVAMFQKEHDTSNTNEALVDTTISCPAMLSDSILNRYLRHLGQSAKII